MKDDKDSAQKSRRNFIRNAGAVAVVASPLGAMAGTVVKDGVTYSQGTGVKLADGLRPYVSNFPGKKDVLLITSRPPHLETPFDVFNDGLLTPNERFFVRYHLANIPTSIDPDTYTLTIKGSVDTPGIFLSFFFVDLSGELWICTSAGAKFSMVS